MLKLTCRPSGSDKQAAQSWGAAEGRAELKDEQAGDAIAQSEKKDAAADGELAAGESTVVEPEEPEEKHMTLEEYLSQQAEKKLTLNAQLEMRKANEGSKVDKSWANAKALQKEEEDYFAGNAGKAKRERERKTKATIEIDQRYQEPERRGGGGGGRGGRGGERGSRGGDRGDRGGRGRGDFGGRGRGDFGGRGRGDGANRAGRGRGGRGGDSTINVTDESAFPSLGS